LFYSIVFALNYCFLWCWFLYFWFVYYWFPIVFLF